LRATTAMAAAATKASGQEILSMRGAMIGDLDAAGDLRHHSGMELPWWLPFGSVPEIPARRLAGDLSNVPGPQIVDVRTEGEFRRGHVRGAVSVPIAVLHARLPALGLAPDRPVVAICLTAHRSIPAVRLLRRSGFDARQLAGGMIAWRAAGFPEEKGPG
jgi:rhodanese-related sulfurtransferase